MIAERIDACEYARLFVDGQAVGLHLYNSVPFSRLTGEATGIEPQYWLMRDTKPRCAIIAGECSDGSLRSPFSAPFGGPVFTKQPQPATVLAAMEALAAECPGMSITLPPQFMQPELNARLAASLLQLGRLDHADLTYHYPLDRIEQFEQRLDRSARQKLHQAEAAGFGFEVLDPADICQAGRAYDVIAANRRSHGYPLAMSLERVRATAAVAAGMMMVLTLGGADVAAVVAQRVRADVAQIVYWGDAPGYAHLRPMNLLPRCVFGHLAGLGFRNADIGPAASGGVVDQGLASYKESIGCVPSLKPTFILPR